MFWVHLVTVKRFPFFSGFPQILVDITLQKWKYLYDFSVKPRPFSPLNCVELSLGIGGLGTLRVWCHGLTIHHNN